MLVCVFVSAYQTDRPGCFGISFDRHTNLRPPFLLWQPYLGELINRDNKNSSEPGDDSNSNGASDNDSNSNDNSDGDGNAHGNLPALISIMATHSTRRMRGTAPDHLGDNATLDSNGQELRSIGLEMTRSKTTTKGSLLAMDSVLRRHRQYWWISRRKI